MAKNLNGFNRDALSNSKEQAKAAAKQSRKPKKPDSDYLRLDLRPSDSKHVYFGKDFKAHVTDRANAEGISATRYIQRLIADDMENTKGKRTQKSKRELLADKLDRLTDRDLETVEKVIDAFVR